MAAASESLEETMSVTRRNRPARDTEAAIAEARALLGERLSTAQAVRDQHGKDESWHIPAPPDAVAFALTTEEVSGLARICTKHRVPLIPFGVGTSLEGHLIPYEGGITVDLSGMDKILRVGTEDMDVTVQAGVRRKQLNEHLRDTGLFFPIDPGADASIGGMCATRASGTNAVRYGTMRENVLGLTVVMADGEIVRTGTRARKSSAGYDLTRLFVGSEGTLGIITEITLKLYGIPEVIASALCSFDTLKGAVDTAIQTIQTGIPIARVELADAVMMAATNRYSKLDLPDHDTLFLEFHGSQAQVEEQAAMVQEIAKANGGGNFAWTTKPEDRTRLWQARHDAAYAAKTMRAGCDIWATDVCVPISALAECIIFMRGEVAKSFLPAPIVGHVGDGNFHMCFVLKRDDPKEVAEAERLNGVLIAKALSLGGTCTGEHGIGIGKMNYLEDELGAAVGVMRRIKQALDPDGILNPGKVLRD
jgi:D-lactate dehydrogenase (cytochrome)